MVRVEVVGQQHLAVLGRGVQAVAVVGDQHLLLADDAPVEAVGAPADDVHLVEAGHPAAGRRGRVAAGVGQLAHAALARQVDPGAGLILIEVQAPGDGLPRTHRRIAVDQADHPVVAVELVGLALGVVRHLEVTDGLHRQHALAAGRTQVAAEIGLPAFAAPVQLVVGHDLLGGLGDREGDAAEGALDHLALQLGARGIARRVVVDPLRRRRAAMGLVDIHPEGLGVLFQQGLGAVGELAGVLGQGVGGDAVQRLLGGKGVAAAATVLEAGQRRAVAAAPGGDAAVLVAGTFGAEGRQVGLEAGGLLRAHGRQGRLRSGCNQRESQQAGRPRQAAVQFIHGGLRIRRWCAATG